MKHYLHHEAADKYPMIEGEAFAAFKADIKANGQRLPIYIQNGLIIDGRNRQKACAELGIEAVYQEIEGDPYELADSLNLHRRHLTKEQRNDMILKKRSEGKSTRQIAEEVGVSRSTVQNVIDEPTEQKCSVETPAEITGKDGKKRKAKASKVIDRDAEILRMRDEGATRSQIAEAIGINPRNVDNAFIRGEREQAKAENERLKAKLAEVVTMPEPVRDELSLSAQQKLDKAIALFEQKKLAEMQQEFQVELQAAIQREQDKINEARKELIELEKRLSKTATTITTILTYDEFKMIRGCLHPDRQPDELKDKFGKAFDLFNRLEQHVNIKAPIDFLRRYGWEHKSPYYKGSKHP